MIFSKIISDVNEYNKMIWQYGQYQVLFQISLPTILTYRNQIFLIVEIKNSNYLCEALASFVFEILFTFLVELCCSTSRPCYG